MSNIPVSAKVIPSTNVQRLTNYEMQTRERKKRMNEFDDKLNETFDVKSNPIPIHNNHDITNWNTLSLEQKDESFLEVALFGHLRFKLKGLQ